MADKLAGTRNYREISDRLVTAGQPNEAQLADAADQQVSVVINLALHDDPRYSLKDEAGCVRALGMEYVHIPVQFQHPTEEDLLRFFDAMDAHAGQKVLIHCAANYRVTAFLGLYGVAREGTSWEQAFAPMRTVWDPDPVWKAFINAMMEKHHAARPSRP